MFRVQGYRGYIQGIHLITVGSNLAKVENALELETNPAWTASRQFWIAFSAMICYGQLTSN